MNIFFILLLLFRLLNSPTVNAYLPQILECLKHPSQDTLVLIQARKNIEKHRQKDFVIEELKPNALYEVNLTKGQFIFGSTINSHLLFLDEEEFSEIYPERIEQIKRSGISYQEYQKKYQETAQKYFNAFSTENVFKWKETNREQNPNWDLTDETIEYMEEELDSIENFRACCVFWNRKTKLPQSLKDKNKDEIYKELIEERIKIIKRYPQIKEWDIINEPINREPKWVGDENLNEVIFDPKEDIDVFVELIKKAREINPDARYYVNEYDLLTGDKVDEFISFISELNSRGAPVDGIGIQGHFFDNNYLSLTEAQKNLEKLARLDIDLKITEFDLTEKVFEKSSQKMPSRKDHFINLITLFYATPQIKGIYLWGFIDSMHWKGEEKAGLFNENFELNEAGRNYFETINGEWATDLQVKTNEQGQLIFRGFPGMYEITEVASQDKFEKELL